MIVSNWRHLLRTIIGGLVVGALVGLTAAFLGRELGRLAGNGWGDLVGAIVGGIAGYALGVVGGVILIARPGPGAGAWWRALAGSVAGIGLVLALAEVLHLNQQPYLLVAALLIHPAVLASLAVCSWRPANDQAAPGERPDGGPRGTPVSASDIE